MFWATVTSRVGPISTDTQLGKVSSVELVRMKCTVEVTRYVIEFLHAENEVCSVQGYSAMSGLLQFLAS